MNIELSNLAVALLAIVVVTAMAFRNRRGLQMRISPKSLEVDLESPKEK